MGYVRRGKVERGRLVFVEPLPLPEGLEVIVQIEPAPANSPADVSKPVEDFAALPFFGMWADRDEVTDAVDWVREGRAQWHQRASRRD
jgi:hypothetical protein